MQSTRKVRGWTVYSAVRLGQARFASVANLLLGGPWSASLEEELGVAYDFLCDLYLETGRDDVQRTADYVGRCLSQGVEAAESSEVEDEEEAAPEPDDDRFSTDLELPYDWPDREEEFSNDLDL